jgi:branched-chain amino acid transport system permease protein
MSRDFLILFALAGWALALPFYASEFVVSLALTCLMYVALSSSWALFCGTTRYLSAICRGRRRSCRARRSRPPWRW